MGRYPEYQCSIMEKSNGITLNVLVDYLLSPLNRKIEIMDKEMKEYHQMDAGDVFELLLHVPRCRPCKKFYENTLRLSVGLLQYKIRKESDRHIMVDKSNDLIERVNEALDIIN